MLDFKYRLYGRIQSTYHALIGLKRGWKSVKSNTLFFAYNKNDREYFDKNCKGTVNCQKHNAGDLLFKGDNHVENIHISITQKQVPAIVHRLDGLDITDKWMECIKDARVEEGWKNSGFYLTAYIRETKQWCLSDWIWTSGAIAQVFSEKGMKHEAIDIADAFLREQLPCGGWVVRYDMVDGKLTRLAAPNDSAYAARHALLTAYCDTGEQKYLDSAEKCARWIMESSYSDGLVKFGYDIDNDKWITDRNIVDIGFTAVLFAELYRLTGKESYHDFMCSFINAYVETFYDEAAGLFSSHVNGDRKRNGGYFSRGQAWAMEGLIAAYSVTKDIRIYDIMEKVTSVIMDKQLKNGGWYCNFQRSRSLMGEDCKGISAIANSLLDWAKISSNSQLLVASAEKALDWCREHTDDETGMIISFTSNGAVGHSPNTSTGILYANAYAIEVQEKLAERGRMC